MKTGSQYKVPVEVCESGLVRVVGQEENKMYLRFKIIGVGETIYWCAEVVDGKPRGRAFAVGSEEIAKWEKQC